MISIIIPLKNEEEIVYQSLNELDKKIKKNKIKNYEIICVINSTVDNTIKEIKKFIQYKKTKKIKIIRSKQEGFGNALLEGIKKSSGQIIVVLNADLINEAILIFAKNNLLEYDLILGSKTTYYSIDKRPFLRKIITKIYNLILKILFKYKGSDTHGIKAFRRKPLIELIQLIEKKNIKKSDIIDTLLVLLFDLKNKRILEIPIEIEEKRASRFKNRAFYLWNDLYLLIKSYLTIKNEYKKN